MKYLVSIADLHCCHKLGLCNPDTELPTENGDSTEGVELTETQRYIWGEYLRHIDYVKRVTGNSPVILTLLGDWMHGDKHPEQLMSNRLSDQIDIAVKAVEPWIKAFKKILCVRIFMGTGAHDPVGGLTVLAAQRLQGLYPRLDIRAVMHELMWINNVKFDLTHPAPSTGGRTWLKGNILRYYLKSAMLDEIAHDEEPARCYLRAHRHEDVHEQVEIQGIPDRRADIWVLPSYCGISYYAKNRNGEYRLHNGMLYIEVGKDDIGKWEMTRSELDTRTVERL